MEKNSNYNNKAQKIFPLASKVDKIKSEPKLEESIAERMILRKGMVAETKKQEKTLNNELFKKFFTDYQSPSDMYKKLRKAEGRKNEDQVYLIKEVLNRMKEAIKNVPENNALIIEENEKILLKIFFTLINQDKA